MTQISEIHGIPKDEIKQRSLLAGKKMYMPYLSLTSGEFKLVNYLDQAKMLYAFTKDPKYGKAITMLENALYSGVHNGINFIGDIPNDLQNVARLISNAKYDRSPASGSIILERDGIQRPKGIASGIHIGDNILPHDSSLDNCNKYAINYVKKYYDGLSDAKILLRLAVPLANQNLVKKYNEGKTECKIKREIEQLMNDGITKFGHHTLYGFLPNGGNKFPSTIITKRILQGAAHEDLARIAGSSKENMKIWLNTAIMRRNSEAQIGPVDQLESNVSVTGLPAEGINEFYALQKVRGGNGINPDTLAMLIKKYGQPNIGVDPATAKLIIETLRAIFIALLAAAPAIISALNNKKADAFAGARGIGTEAFGPQANDWNNDGIPDSASGSSNNLITFGLLAAGAYLLLDEKE